MFLQTLCLPHRAATTAALQIRSARASDTQPGRTRPRTSSKKPRGRFASRPGTCVRRRTFACPEMVRHDVKQIEVPARHRALRCPSRPGGGRRPAGRSCMDRCAPVGTASGSGRQGGHDRPFQHRRDNPVRAALPDLRPADLHRHSRHLRRLRLAGGQCRSRHSPDHRQSLDRRCLRLPRLPPLPVQQPFPAGDARRRADDRAFQPARQCLSAGRQVDTPARLP